MIARICLFFTLGAVLSGCVSSSIPPAEKARLTANNLAYKAYIAGNLDDAARRYKALLQKAMGDNDSVYIADYAYNLALVTYQQEHYEYARSAVLIAMRHAPTISYAHQLLQARIALAMGDYATCDALTQKILSELGNQPISSRIDLLFVRIDLNLAQNQIEEAENLLTKVVSDSSDPSDTRLAMICDRNAQIFMQKEQWKNAAEEFDRATAGWTASQRPKELLQSTERAAAAWKQADQPETACLRYISSAEIAYGLKKLQTAAKNLDDAHQLAQINSNPTLLDTTKALLTLFRSGTPK